VRTYSPLGTVQLLEAVRQVCWARQNARSLMTTVTPDTCPQGGGTREGLESLEGLDDKASCVSRRKRRAMGRETSYRETPFLSPVCSPVAVSPRHSPTGMAPRRRRHHHGLPRRLSESKSSMGTRYAAIARKPCS
jgi:hypothetical protein